MKKYLALSLGLLTGLAGNAAFASKTSTIYFEGRITPETCPIDVVNPGDGIPTDRLAMGNIPVGRFTGADVELLGTSFDIRIPDKASCGITEGNAFVTFKGSPDSSNKYFKVNPVPGAATNVSIVIKDITNASIPPGGTSADYLLNDSGPTNLRFNAYYRSTAAGVTAGPASAAIEYTVAYK